MSYFINRRSGILVWFWVIRVNQNGVLPHLALCDDHGHLRRINEQQARISLGD
jgi:hypothetical protein